MSRSWSAGLATALIGALAAIVLGFLTFGVQVTASPRGVPLAIAVPAGSPAAPLAEQVAAQGGDAVDWRIVDDAAAADLLDRAEVYGVLGLAAEPGGAIAVGITTSGAVNASGTAAAEQVLNRAADGLARAVTERTGVAPAVTAATVHPSLPAARSLPLSATALLWIAGLAANVVLVLLAGRAGRRFPVGAALTGAAGLAVAGPAVVFGFAELWSLEIAWTWAALGFLALVGGTFALVQAGILRLLGIRGAALLALLYLSAPAVAGQVPELLHPAYRDLLWSWTPIRFSTEGLRSLLFSGGIAPAVAVGIWVFAALAVAGLVVLLWPARHAAPEPAAAPGRPVPVG